MNDVKTKLLKEKMEDTNLFLEFIFTIKTNYQGRWNHILKQENFDKGVEYVNFKFFSICKEDKKYKEGQFDFSEPKMF